MNCRQPNCERMAFMTKFSCSTRSFPCKLAMLAGSSPCFRHSLEVYPGRRNSAGRPTPCRLNPHAIGSNMTYTSRIHEQQAPFRRSGTIGGVDSTENSDSP